MQVPDLIRPFIERIATLDVPYMVTGSTAGIAYGEPRMTHDVDIVVALAVRDVDAFVEAFPLDDFYCPPPDVLAIEIKRGQRGHCNLITTRPASRRISTSPSTSFIAGDSRDAGPS